MIRPAKIKQKRRIAGFSLIFCAAILAYPVAPQAGAQSTLSAANIGIILRNANLVKSGVPLNATVLDKKVLIITDRGQRGNTECKIDAVMIAKTIMDAFPDQIMQVKVIFSHPDAKLAVQANITAGDVKAYGAGELKPEALLASIELMRVDGASGDTASSAAAVVQGPLMETRLLLLHRIESLKAHGTGVKPFQDLFAQIEQNAKNGDEKQVKGQTDYLAEKLSEQEALLRQAQAKLATGQRGAKAGSASSTSTSMAGASELNARLATWESKVNQWKREGRDCDQLVASFALVRMWLTSNPDMAKKYLDALDATGVEPPRR